MERLKPLNDFIFKKIFGEEESKDTLIAFLNATLDLKERRKLATLQIIGPAEVSGELITDKTSRLDVLAETEDGTRLNIEVQLTNQKNMERRTLFYWGRLFLQGVSRNEDYRELNKVITINILDFEFLEIGKYHSKFHLWEDNIKDYMLTDMVEIHFIEMPKFRRLREKNLKENPLHRWLTFFEQELPEEVLELIKNDMAIKRAEEKLEYLSSDPVTRALYQAREDSARERANLINTGKEERSIEIAKSALKKGLDIPLVVEITGLDEDTVKQLHKDVFDN